MTKFYKSLTFANPDNKLNAFACFMHIFAFCFILSYLLIRVAGVSLTNTEADFIILLLIIPIISSSVIFAIILFIVSLSFFLVYGLRKGLHSKLALLYMLLPAIVLLV